MSVTGRAERFGTDHKMAEVRFSGNVFFLDGRPEAGPTCTRVKFAIGAKQHGTAANALI